MKLDNAKALIQRAEMLMADNEQDVDSDQVLELAAASGCTAYDCEFVALAEQLDVPLITSDKKLIAAFPDVAVPLTMFS